MDGAIQPVSYVGFIHFDAFLPQVSTVTTYKKFAQIYFAHCERIQESAAAGVTGP